MKTNLITLAAALGAVAYLLALFWGATVDAHEHRWRHDWGAVDGVR